MAFLSHPPAVMDILLAYWGRYMKSFDHDGEVHRSRKIIDDDKDSVAGSDAPVIFNVDDVYLPNGNCVERRNGERRQEFLDRNLVARSANGYIGSNVFIAGKVASSFMGRIGERGSFLSAPTTALPTLQHTVKLRATLFILSITFSRSL